MYRVEMYARGPPMDYGDKPAAAVVPFYAAAVVSLFTPPLTNKVVSSMAGLL